MKINKLYNENCLLTMSRMSNNFIDLVVTSPPYDNLRDYNGYTFKFKKIATELWRVIKDGGVVVWIVNDATIKGSETGTSFKQALFFMDLGFRLHDTMIYKTSKPPLNHNRYQSCFEYMFVFSKGKPSAFNPIMEKCKYSGSKTGGTFWNTDGSKKDRYYNNPVSDTKIKDNIWYIVQRNRINHPAIFPEQLANDHIISWSNKGDLVYDPFMGSGTTGKMAILNNRNWIGSEISLEYCEIANNRINKYSRQLKMELKI